MPRTICENVNRLVCGVKKFPTVSDRITQALPAFFGTRYDREHAEQLFREYLASDTVRECIRCQIREAPAEVQVPARSAGERSRPDP